MAAVTVEPGEPFWGHAGQVTAVAYAPDGATLATGGTDGTMRIWDVHTGKQLRALNGHTNWVQVVVSAPDGATLATGGADRTVRVWEASTGKLVRALGEHAGSVRAVAYAPDGVNLAVGGDDRAVRIWDASTGKLVRTLREHAGSVRAVAYAPDGVNLAVGGDDRAVRIWDASTGKQLRALGGHTYGVRAVAYAPDGTTLATGGGYGTVRVWEASTGKQVMALSGHTGPVRAVAYAPDGATLATAGDDRKVRIWDVRTSEEVRVLAGHTGSVQAVVFSPDGASLATASDDGTIRIWNPRTGRQVAGTGFGVARPMRPLAGVSSDQPSVEDLLGVGEDIETLAMLAAALDTQPPLAIALLGDWGSGKSTVMHQMQQRVRTLADLSVNNLGMTSFAARVRQVTFNAWHYSDDHVWTGLVEHLFRELATPTDNQDGERDPQAVAGERRQLAEDLAVLDRREQRLTADLVRFSAASSAGLARRLGSPAAAGRLVVEAARELVRDVRTYLWLLLGWGVFGGAVAAGYLWFHAPINGWVTAAAALTAPVLVVWRSLRSLHRRYGGLVAQVRGGLERRRTELRRERAEMAARLAEVDAAVRLAGFLTDRASPAAYQEYRGLLGQVHRDLQRLDADLRAAHAQWRATPTPTPPLERIVLYIDDLDRCPPQRVVEVLAAVHLMLALPLFVVVVAVDPRWLLGSLRHHYQELFTAAAEDTGVQNGLATPLDYLDKIFQIPFAVPTLTGSVASTYVEALLGPSTTGPTPADLRATPGPADGTPAPAEDLPAPDATASGHNDRTSPLPSTGDPVDSAGSVDLALERDTPLRPEPADFPDGNGPSSPSRRDDESGPALAGRSGGSAATTVDLRPEGLRLDAKEIRFLAALGPLLPTPRAAKKLVNLYRLIRIGIPAADISAFLTDRGHRPPQILLALVVGAPGDARTILCALLHAPPDRPLRDLLRDQHPDSVDESDWKATAHTRHRLADVLDTLGADLAATSIGDCQPWVPRIARYSFHTRHLTDPRPPQPVPDAQAG